jgi:hypothetical protein
VIHGFENGMDSFSRFIHNFNRLLTPLHSLKSEAEVEEFMNGGDAIFSKDYLAPLFKKAKNQESLKAEMSQQFSDHYATLPFQTRVVVFFYDADEYKDEMLNLKEGARFSSTRENLRIAYVSD